MIEILMEGMSDGKGGKETYIINIFDFIDKNRFRITFIAYDEKIAYEEYLLASGAEILHLPARSCNPYAHYKALVRLLEQRKFDAVWSHKTGLSACELLFLAEKRNIPVRMVHSHSSANMGGKMTYLMHCINKKFIFRFANEYLACSEKAAKWFYGNHPSKIVKNGIDLKKYKFDRQVRNRIRKNLGFEDNFVIGHVGRFSKEKNHKKLMEVFSLCKKKKRNVKLVLCGDGEERRNIEKWIDEYGIQKDVVLLGAIDNVHEVLQAIDLLVMPSLFEGLPFSLLEAQAAGLKCVVSNGVSRESDILGWNHYLSLEEDNRLWAKVILDEELAYDRLCGYEKMRDAGFDMVQNIKYIEQMIGRQ